MKCTLTIKDEVWCLLSGLTPVHIEFLWKEFGKHPEGYWYMRPFQMRVWDGFVRFFEKTGKTYTRLLPDIVPYIEAWGYEIELVDKRVYYEAPEINLQILRTDSQGVAVEAKGGDIFGEVYYKGKLLQLRPYQVQAVIKAVESGSGFLRHATGAGKSLTTAALSKVYSDAGYPAITIVPSDDLVGQTLEWYKIAGLDVGVYSGSSKDLDHPCVVASWQAIQYNPKLLKKFLCIIWDEAHGAKSTVASKLLNEDASHAPFKFGVTGTMPKDEVSELSLRGAVGEILHTITARWLIDNGFLAEIEIQPVELNETYIDEEFPNYDAEKAFLSKSTPRMEKIADLIISQTAVYGNTLVLVNSIPFGKKLAALIKGAVFLYGESKKDNRKEYYDLFETEDNMIVIASSGIASTGISIDRVFALILVDPGKSFIKAIQSIGRGLRMANDKNKIHVFDVHSKLKWAKKHFRERKKFYAEAEYPVNKLLSLKV